MFLRQLVLSSFILILLISCSTKDDEDGELIRLTLDFVFDGDADLNCIYTAVNLVLDSEGKVFILDTIQMKILVFDDSGDFLYEFGQKGEGPGEFNFPFLNFDVDEEGIVYTIDGHMLKIFSNAGQFLRSANLHDGFIFDVAALDSTRIYVNKVPISAALQNSSSNPAAILVDASGATISEIGTIHADTDDFYAKWNLFSCVIDTDQDNSLYFTSVASYEVCKYDSSGTFIWATKGNCPFTAFSEPLPGYTHTLTPVVWDLDVADDKVFVLWAQEGTEIGFRIDIYDSGNGEYLGYFYSQTPSEERNSCIEISNRQFYITDYSSGLAYKFNMEYQTE